jgi:hypothetical protein
MAVSASVRMRNKMVVVVHATFNIDLQLWPEVLTMVEYRTVDRHAQATIGLARIVEALGTKLVVDRNGRERYEPYRGDGCVDAVARHSRRPGILPDRKLSAGAARTQPVKVASISSRALSWLPAAEEGTMMGVRMPA